MEHPYFPVFIDISGKRTTVIGGGNVALRRVNTLLRFGADVCVISPSLCSGFDSLRESGKIRTVIRKYEEKDLEGAELVIAATDDRTVNRKVWRDCRERKIPVNTADDHTLCDFYFPSVVMTEDVVVAINSGGKDPGLVKAVREKIERTVSAPTAPEGHPQDLSSVTRSDTAVHGCPRDSGRQNSRSHCTEKSTDVPSASGADF